MRSFNLIYAKTLDNGIGLNGTIPWTDKGDMKHFKDTTTGHIVIMGRVTALSIKTPLREREMMIVSKDKSFESCMEDCYSFPNKKIFVIGGAQLYNYVIEKYSHLIHTIYETTIVESYTCDTFINSINDNEYNLLWEIKLSTGNYVMKLTKKNIEESNYLKLVNDVLENGIDRSDRTGVGTKAVFAKTLEYSLENHKIPLLTTKFVPLRLVFEELRWMLLGIPSINYLKEKNVHIWDANIDDHGGTSGPIYPFQWRHAGAEYFHDEIQSKEGIDQIKNIIDLILNNETSRRILLCNWNCRDIDKMALPPCHVMAQWFVDGDYLDCMMIQRSGDLMLGVPFNIVSYSMLTHLIAFMTNKKARKFTHVIGDCHIYNNHVEVAKEQIKRTPTPFPSIKILSNNPTDISDIKWQDIQLLDYTHQGKLEFQMAV